MTGAIIDNLLLYRCAAKLLYWRRIHPLFRVQKLQVLRRLG